MVLHHYDVFINNVLKNCDKPGDEFFTPGRKPGCLCGPIEHNMPLPNALLLGTHGCIKIYNWVRIGRIQTIGTFWVIGLPLDYEPIVIL